MVLEYTDDARIPARPISAMRGIEGGSPPAFMLGLMALRAGGRTHDLARYFAELGSVRVTEFMTIERYSHVMHLVSNVVGRLRPGADALDVLSACFPAGTVTGAPKIRAMEIIDELEPTQRGPYAGAVGYVSYSGNLDSCITIRTIVCHGRRASVQVGAGIVADSDPKAEWNETCSKARGLVLALRIAAAGARS